MEIQCFLRAFCQKYKYATFENLELDKAGGEEVPCFECKKAMLGICLRTNRIYVCLSCCDVSTKMESLLLHCRRKHDDMIFTKELQNEGKEDGVCFGCEEPVVGPGYECSARKCKFLLHQSCAELPLKMQHPFHPDHTLSLSVPRPTCYCDACGKHCNGCFSYSCDKCKFNLDVTCTSLRTKNRDDCQHVLRPLLLRFQFTCDVCGEEGENIASHCNLCQLLIHGKCNRFSRTIRITFHPHPLTITYSPREVRDFKEHKSIFCNLCYEKIKTQYAAYFCKRCGFVSHLQCAYKYFENVCEESDDFDDDDEIDGGFVEGAEEIQHFGHSHILILYEELVDNKLCDGCMELISAPFYSCRECNYFLHNRCAHLPRKKRHILHQHKLTLVSQVPSFGGQFCCNACFRSSQGFSYNCAKCQFNLDVKCFSMPEHLKYGGHEHSLHLAINSVKKCTACERDHCKKKGVFVCTDCELVFCFECATLPFEARLRYDKHPLQFAFAAEVNTEDYYCLICETKRNQKEWIYYCAECDFPAHIECIVGRNPYMKFGHFFTSEDHEHPLTFISKNEFSDPCDVCGKAVDGDRYFDGMAAECGVCKFSVHFLRNRYGWVEAKCLPQPEACLVQEANNANLGQSPLHETE